MAAWCSLPLPSTLCSLRACTIVLAVGVLNLFFVWLVMTAKGMPASSLLSTGGAPAPGAPPDIRQWNGSAVVNATACGQALGIPTVAMMFLTVDEVFHEPTWRLWYQHAADLVPASSVVCNGTAVNATCDCDRARLAGLRELCRPQDKAPVLQRQHLFNVYIHSRPEYAFPEDSIFFGREIAERSKVEWGTHQLVDATKALLRAALRQPLNQKFILLSESHIPLYSPMLVYQQLMSEPTSRLDSWGLQPTDLRRWTQRLVHNDFNHGSWRKSSQWFALRRDHAQAVVQDTVLNDKFAEHCKNGFDSELNRWRDCFSDEHYIPSLIAYLQRGHETDGFGRLVHVVWENWDVHPKSFSPKEVTLQTFRQMRGDGAPCHTHQVDIREVKRMFVPAKRITPATCQRAAPSYNQTLRPQCPLLARKFPRDTVMPLFKLVRDCSNGLAIVNDGSCRKILGMRGRQLLGSPRPSAQEVRRWQEHRHLQNGR